MRHRYLELVWPAALCLGTLACSATSTVSARELADANDTGRTLAAKSAEERQLLQHVPQLRSDHEELVGGLRVVAEPVYEAASGRRCRGITNRQTGERRLTCSDGGAWFFVPDVFGAAKEP